MANDLIEMAEKGAETTLSSPACKALLRIAMGTVEWPGQRTRKYLAGGSKLTDEQRREAESALAKLHASIGSADHPDAGKARLAIVAKMLMAYPSPGGTEASARARGEAYMDALDDVPPWAIQRAVRAWNRGEGAGNHDFAPAPARLRALAMQHMEPIGAAIAHLEDLLHAWTHDEALDIGRQAPASSAGQALVAKLRAM